MRGYLLAIFLSAVFLYYVLHCILWRTNDYGVTPVEMKPRNKIRSCLSKPAFASLLSQNSAYILRKGIEELSQTSFLFTQIPYNLFYSLFKNELILTCKIDFMSHERLQTAGLECFSRIKIPSLEINPDTDNDLLKLAEIPLPRLLTLVTAEPDIHTLLRHHQFHPFLCAANFKNTASFYGSDKFDLPYGIRASATHFRLALWKLPNCDLFDEFDNVPCKKCVVVGNGGILKNKTLGEKIDSYDVIIRMNNGPVLGHEEEVGRRTTFRLFYPESVFSDPNHSDPNTTVILTAFKPLDLKWLLELLTGGKINPNGFWKEPALNLIYKPYQIRILDPYITRMAAYELLHFPKVFPKNEKPKHPTTGIIAITLAFHICHEVHLAGFKYNFSDLKSPLHYYGNATMSLMSENEYHNVTAEQLFLKDIIEKNFVTDLTQE